MKLIPLDTVLAEIKNLQKHYLDKSEYDFGYNMAIEDSIKAVNSLEVKEVDLEKEIKESIIDEWCDEWSGDVGNWIRYRRGTTSMTIEDVIDIAKHFFELVLKTQKGEWQ